MISAILANIRWPRSVSCPQRHVWAPRPVPPRSIRTICAALTFLLLRTVAAQVPLHAVHPLQLGPVQIAEYLTGRGVGDRDLDVTRRGLLEVVRDRRSVRRVLSLEVLVAG